MLVKYIYFRLILFTFKKRSAYNNNWLLSDAFMIYGHLYE